MRGHVVALLLLVLAALASTRRVPTFPVLDTDGKKIYTTEKKLALREHVVKMFYHGYNNYMTHAFPQDELKPLSCTGSNVFGGYSMTLIDSLDMLALVGDDAEFFKQVAYLSKNVNFDADLKVSVFETTIRVLGGLLSAHVLALQKNADALGDYDGGLLPLAVRVADKLIPAFDTPTGIPFNEIHLQKGINKEDGHTSCPAAAGTLLLEFGLLAQLTGNCTYLNLARRALFSVWRLRSAHQVVGTMIDIFSGTWINPQTNIGASVDSFFEYMFKAYVVFDDEEYLEMWLDAYKAMQKYTYYGGWYLTGTIEHNHGPIENFDHQINALQAFWPGLQSLAGDTLNALDAYEKMLCVVRTNTFMPEYLQLRTYLDRGQDRKMGPGYPLRPEFLESTYYLLRATSDDTFLAVAEDFLHSLLDRSKVKCGFAAIVDVFQMTLEDKMDSFMLSETLKYLYFIFTPSNDELMKAGYLDASLHVIAGKGHLRTTVRPPPFDLEGHFVVNTEAHPVPLSKEIRDFHRQCTQREPIFLPQNSKRFMPEEGGAFGPSKEHFGRSSMELRRMCPKIDYMTQIAPFIARLHNHRKVCFEKDFSLRPLKKHDKKGPGTPSKMHDPTSDSPKLRSFIVPMPNPHPTAAERVIGELLLELHQPITTTPIIPTIHAGMVVLTPKVEPSVFFLEHSKVMLSPAFHGPSLPTWPAEFSGNAEFCPHGFTHSFDNVLSVAAPYTLIVARAQIQRSQERFVMLRAASPLCPKADGSFDMSHRTLRDQVSDTIPDSVWYLNFTLPDGTLRPESRFGLIVARGGCTFKEKAHVAQLLGASFLVVANSDDSGFVMSDADLPFTTEITIPVFLLRKTDAGILERQSSSNTVRGVLPTIAFTCVQNVFEQLLLMNLMITTRGQSTVLAPLSLAIASSTRSLSVLELTDDFPFARNAYLGPRNLVASSTWTHAANKLFAVAMEADPPTWQEGRCRNCYIDAMLGGHAAEGTMLAAHSEIDELTMHSFFTFSEDEVGIVEVRLFMDHLARPPAIILQAPIDASWNRYLSPWVHHMKVSPEQFGACFARVLTRRAPVTRSYFESLLDQLQAWTVLEGHERARVVARYVAEVPHGDDTRYLEIVVFENEDAMESYLHPTWWTLADAHDGHVLNAAVNRVTRADKPVKLRRLGKLWLQAM
jgi:mannosidase alpha-like ER degradation enhancer 2